MKNKCLYARKRVSGIMVFLLCSAVVFMAGCEPLRKKFTRKKRMSQVKGIDPILDPVDYPDKVKTAQSVYRHHYALWKGWVNDFALIGKSKNDKRAVHDIDQMLLQLNAMNKLLPEDKQKVMTGIIEDLEKVRDRFQKSTPRRNYSSINRQVTRIDKRVRLDLSFKKVKDALTETPSEKE
ncbi:MAG: hypothetical protein KAJ18_00850 [Candidatus Omnitrophica bacterium]|nr:hypothetical protein [Candidatus Omnitrophota bacterium]